MRSWQLAGMEEIDYNDPQTIVKIFGAEYLSKKERPKQI